MIIVDVNRTRQIETNQWMIKEGASSYGTISIRMVYNMI